MPEEQKMVPSPDKTAIKEELPKPSFPKKDVWVAAAVGLILAAFLIPIVKQSDVIKMQLSYSIVLLIAAPILSVLGMLLALLIAQKLKFVYQAAKFVLVGALNTFIDWGVLNILMLIFAITSGPFYSVFKGAGFVIASINSYFWNKYWTFNKPVSSVSQPGEQKSASKEILQFFVISLIGFVMNVGVASLIVNWWGPQFGITAKLWANVGALCGTLVGLVWNFLGYKLVVFKS